MRQIKNPAIIAAILVNTIVSVIVFTNRDLLPLLAIDSESYAKPWQLITFNFVHVNYIHLAANMIALYSFAPLVLKNYGNY